jgi:uracil-DNA glycosylase family 4
MPATRLKQLQTEVIGCTKCPRLVAWCEQVAKEKVKRFAGETYWGKPLPSLGDPNARLLLVGLAPAAHGGTRTGRMFTGDRSGDWLFEALFDFQFANQPEATARNDGLTLRDCYITAALRCAPPQNKPTAEEMQNCRDYLNQEFALLKRVRVIVALGKIGFDATLKALRATSDPDPELRPQFGHGHEYQMNGRLTLIASYHPSQQNTFTGRLTKPMFHQIFHRVRELLD